MRIEVKLYATMKEFMPANQGDYGTCVLDLDEGATVGAVVSELKIPDDLPKMLLINGQVVKADRELQEGEMVSIFPPIAGG